MFFVFKFARMVIYVTLFLIALATSGYLPEVVEFAATQAKGAFESSTISYRDLNDRLHSGS